MNILEQEQLTPTKAVALLKKQNTGKQGYLPI